MYYTTPYSSSRASPSYNSIRIYYPDEYLLQLPPVKHHNNLFFISPKIKRFLVMCKIERDEITVNDPGEGSIIGETIQWSWETEVAFSMPYGGSCHLLNTFHKEESEAGAAVYCWPLGLSFLRERQGMYRTQLNFIIMINEIAILRTPVLVHPYILIIIWRGCFLSIAR